MAEPSGGDKGLAGALFSPEARAGLFGGRGRLGRVRDSGCGATWWNTGYVYVNGALEAEYRNSTTYFVSTDHLGSTRIMTDVSGNAADSLDFLPYGEQISGGTFTTHKFTGKERDAETGNDYFGAGYYSSSIGRFMTPDWSDETDPVPYADFNDPQTLNLYSYVRNNPLTLTDADGHYHQVCTTSYSLEHDTGTLIVKAQCNEVPDAWDLLAGMLLNVSQVAQQTVNAVNTAAQWLAEPRNPGCMAAATGTGSAIGAGVGALGIAGGPAVAVSDPSAIALGGSIGYGVGFISCMSGTGAGGARGGHREKTRGANPKDRENIRAVAREYGIDVRKCGDYVEKVNPFEGRGPSDNYTFDELRQLAEQFRAGDR